LVEGAEVEFDVLQGDKGPRADNVVVIRVPEKGGKGQEESW